MSIPAELDPLHTATLFQAFRYRIAVAKEFDRLPIYNDAPGQAAAVLESLATEHEYLEAITPIWPGDLLQACRSFLSRLCQ